MWRCWGTRTDTEQRFKERESLKGQTSFVIKDYLKVLKLFPVAFRNTDGMDGTGLKLKKNWPIFSSFDPKCSKNPQEIYYG